MRLVLDTNVVVSALLWNGAPEQLLRISHSEGIQLYTSTPLLEELTETLSKSKFERKIAASLHSIDQLVNIYTNLVSVIRPLFVPRLAPDPDDDVVIGTALAAKASFLVTGDRSLLSVAEYEGVRIVSVSEALQAIGPNIGHSIP
ncbi:MAG TPA: putative toxin-antitoxin system toxin component, PIN family [Terracidiphilus sp.]|nr:putative toxin-antitoxin system toxin component, PIN family [Terracidiphilus sp.]